MKQGATATQSGLNRLYAWSTANLPVSVDQLSDGTPASATLRHEFLYGPERERTREIVRAMSGTTIGPVQRTIYSADSIEKEIDAVAGTTKIRTYLPLGLGFTEEAFTGTSIAPSSIGTPVERYFHKDNLGSPVIVTDASQAVLERMAYDAWGRRRQSNGLEVGWQYLNAQSAANTLDHRGYTGQEQLDDLSLVHLNGRVYDPMTGRMTSPDPTIPDPYDLQSLNRASYVRNSPMDKVDPTGFAEVTGSYINAHEGAQGVGTGAAATYSIQYANHSGESTSPAPAQSKSDAVATLKKASPPANAVGQPSASAGSEQSGGSWVSNLAQRLKNGILKGMFRTDAQMNEWGQGILAAQKLGPAAVAEFLRHGNLPTWPKDATALVVTGGASLERQAAESAETEAAALAKATRCFPAGTKVATPKGDINIEDIRVGDAVYTYDPKTGESVEQKVTGLLHNFTYHWVDVQVGSEVIRATRSHPFWVESEHEWVEAADLKRGMLLRLENGQAAAITGISVVDLQQPEPTYNLEVEVNHDYFVGATHVLVHNGEGSYTITFASGKQYVGKGDLSRMAASVARVTKQTGDRVVSTQWTPANGTADSYVQEEMRMRAAGGPGGNTHNVYNSPGNKIAAASGCP